MKKEPCPVCNDGLAKYCIRENGRDRYVCKACYHERTDKAEKRKGR